MKRLVAILFVLSVCMLSSCSNQDESNDTVFKGENEHWKMTYTISPNQMVKDYEGKDITSSIESIRLKYKGSIKEMSNVQKYRIAVQGAGMNTLFDKIADKRFEETGEIYVQSYTSTNINKNEKITGWVLLDLNKQNGQGTGMQREGLDLKPE